MNNNEITQEQVQARVDDWIKRLDLLYTQVKDWLGSVEGLRFDENQNTIMYEELMQKFGISPIRLPMLNIYDGEKVIARLKPIGLWIIGVNGRVDLMLPDGAVILVDESQQFAPSRWVVHGKRNFRKGQLLTKEHLLNLLGMCKHECV